MCAEMPVCHLSPTGGSSFRVRNCIDKHESESSRVFPDTSASIMSLSKRLPATSGGADALHAPRSFWRTMRRHGSRLHVDSAKADNKIQMLQVLDAAVRRQDVKLGPPHAQCAVCRESTKFQHQSGNSQTPALLQLCDRQTCRHGTMPI